MRSVNHQYIQQAHGILKANLMPLSNRRLRRLAYFDVYFQNYTQLNLYNRYKKIVNSDGVRVSEKDGWWLLRASNTQPAIVLRCESLTQEGLEFQKRAVEDELSEFNIDVDQKIIS